MRAPVMRIAVIGVALSACSSVGDGSDSDAGPTIDGGPVIDAGSADAGGPVRLTDSKIFAQRGSSTQITFGLDADGPGSCLSEIISGCEVQTCEPAAGVPASAGTVTITTPDGPQDYVPGEDGLYPSSPGVVWDPGETVALSVAGSDDIAAFEASVAGPGSVTAVSAPSFDAPVEVARDQPLAFSWTGADTAVTAAVNCPATGEVGMIQVRCRFPDGIMSSAMPAEALGHLPACDNGNVYLLTEERVLTGPPGLVVRFAARGPIFAGTGVID